MTRPRQIAFGRLVVHRLDEASPRAPAVSRARTNFDALLLPRPAGAPAPGGSKTVAPDPDLPVMAVTAEDPEADESSDESHDDACAPHEDPAQTDWTSALMPTSASLGPLLATAVPGCNDEPGAPDLVASISEMIAGFCNERSVDASEGWSVRIPLRPDLLADTTLELTVSSYWLALRFLTTDAGARRLISRHQESLRNQLCRLLKRQREISIAID